MKWGGGSNLQDEVMIFNTSGNLDGTTLDSLLHWVLDVPGDLFPPDNPRLDDEEDGAQEVQEGTDEGETK